ncbi:FAD-binding domain-containing protein [Hirschfeldia incana]|nr:FAD-binding domain-containing protein [Hirschfeldia incana]
METVVVIVGAGPAGLATSVCLNKHSIPNVILEKEDIYASLWKKRAYDRLKLHLAKNFCQLPFMPHGPDVPTFMPKEFFIDYLDSYVTHFDINPRYNRTVTFSMFDVSNNKWRVGAENTVINGGIGSIEGKTLTFENGLKQDFDAILFATGYKSSVCNWLKNYEYVMKDDGFPKNPMPQHWKGEKNIYCAGFSRKGIAGVAQDAVSVAEDIKSSLETSRF